MASNVAPGPFEPTWESLQQYRVPAWYEDGKFGIFIHWGPYSVPAYENEWYPRRMYVQGTDAFDHHVATYGPQRDFGYKDFIPEFRAEQFDPQQWAQLFKQSGARFVVPVAEHHDGFAMYDTDLSPWNAVAMGPKRDVIGELAAAVRSEDMVFGVSNHRYEHYWFFDGGLYFDSGVEEPENAGLYGPPVDSFSRPAPEFLEDWLARAKEVVDKYHPQLVWFDWRIEDRALEPYLLQFAAHFYNTLGADGDWDTSGPAINYKFDAFKDGTAVFDVERGQLSGIRPTFWQNDTSLYTTSWSHVENQQYKTVESLIGDLVDIVSKNGALLLNVGPRADGSIPDRDQEMLREIGTWLAVNGDAIYGTRPWVTFGEGPTDIPEGAFTDTQREPFTAEDIRFTTKDESLFAILLRWPGERATIRSLGTGAATTRRVTSVSLLGSDAALAWDQTDEALHVDLPEERPCNHAYALRIAISD